MRHAKDFIVADLKRDSELRRIHTRDAITTLMEGDIRTGLLMLRNLVNATCGFSALGKALETDPKSLMRMLSLRGNPTTINLFKIIDFLLEQERLHIDVKRAA